MLMNYLISIIENMGYFNILLYIILGYMIYYIFSFSIVSFGFFIIGVLVGSYITSKFKNII